MSNKSEELDELGAEALAEITASVKGSKKKKLSEREDKSPEEIAALREQRKAQLIQVLSRGQLNSRLDDIISNCVPENRVGKFVRDRPEDITRYQNLGYTFEVTENARGLHGTADGRVRVGDVVLMTIDRESHELLHEIRQDQIKRKLGSPKQEYLSRADRGRNGGIVPLNESHTEIVRR